jgi:hypothetical protein
MLRWFSRVADKKGERNHFAGRLEEKQRNQKFDWQIREIGLLESAGQVLQRASDFQKPV